MLLGAPGRTTRSKDAMQQNTSRVLCYPSVAAAQEIHGFPHGEWSQKTHGLAASNLGFGGPFARN